MKTLTLFLVFLCTTSYAEVAAHTDAAQFVISIPYNAVLYCNESRVKMMGNERHLVSKGLQPASTYTYVFEAIYNAPNGEKLKKRKRVKAMAGDSIRISFFESLVEPPDEIEMHLNRASREASNKKSRPKDQVYQGPILRFNR